MSLASRLAAVNRRPTATVTLGGRRWSDWLSLSREQAYGQNISGGEVVGRNPPVTPTIGMAISWTWGYDGFEVAGFTGVVAEVDYAAYPERVGLKVADPLWKADRQRKDIATDPLNSIAASEAIEQILAGAGITRVNIPTLSASGSAWGGGEWILGTLTPVSFPNTTALAAAAAICETLGYWLYADASGVVRAAQMERRPSDTPFRTLRYGQDFLIAGPPGRKQPDTRLNRIVVRGANTGVQGAQIYDAWQTGAADRSREFSFPLIEYVNESQAGAASITGVAKRLLKLWSREPNVIDVPRLKADPRLAVGQTVAIEDRRIKYSSARPFFVYALSTSLDRRAGDFSQSLTLDGGTGDQGYTTVPPPSASFTWRIVRETLNGAGVIELFLDGTGSVSNTAGEIVSYAWSTATTTYGGTPTTATGPKAMFIYPGAATEATVTLTVTDTSSKTGAYTQTIPLAGDELIQPVTRAVSLALGAAWAVSPNGGQTWNVEATGDATLVPEQSETALIATRASGATGLRQTVDGLASASTNLASLGGTITALSVTPGTGIVWAAVGTSLYRSVDQGATFSLWGTLPASISAVLEDPVVPNSVFVLAGANMYQATTPTPGSSWVVLYAGPTGATARHLVRGQSGATTWICYTGTFTGSPLQRVEGPLTALFDPPVAEIRAIALGPDELTVYAWDADGLCYWVNSADGVATAAPGGDLAAGETAQHALHDPDDSIVYLATFGAAEGTTYKYFPLQDALLAFYTPASGQQAHRVGLAAQIALAVELVLIPTYATGDDDFIWHYRDGMWTGQTPPRAGWLWLWIAANPFNPDEWLLFGTDSTSGAFNVDTGATKIESLGTTYSPLYRTTDAGATWSEVILDPTGSVGNFTIDQVEFDAATGGDWLVYGYGTTAGQVWRGSGNSAPAPITLAGAGQLRMAAGRGGDFVLAGVQKGLAYLPTGASSLTVVEATGSTTGAIDLTGGTSRELVRGSDAGYTADYRDAALASQSTTNRRTWVAGAADGVYLSGGANGIVQVTDPTSWDATASVVAGGDVPTSFIRSDRQTRISVAARVLGEDYSLCYDGTRWFAVADPPGLADASIADRLEVIRRAT